jgi:hypothetical protein
VDDGIFAVSEDRVLAEFYVAMMLMTQMIMLLTLRWCCWYWVLLM